MRLIIVCLFALFSIGAQAQVSVDVFNVKLTDKNLPYLYKGVTNRLAIKSEGENAAYTLQSSIGGRIETGDSSHVFYYSTFNKEVAFDTLKILDGNKVIYTRIFTLLNIPDPVLKLGNISSKYASVTAILNDPELRIILPDCFFSIQMPIISYTFSFKGHGLLGTGKTYYGGPFNSELIQIIEKLKPGDIIYFEDIKVKTPTGTRTLTESLIITIRTG